ncbi:hypothetical protein HK097_007626 [Rhizophlyctis rosea]|uniref:Uncharacterized protein n=1 Tax=Rhizophlyctis rosea TaxID=64517 RepID=A0AAD5SBE4_9FUNG|nr:hypothetical protein HK097_007626 [Rhizophlyctis rosea]
MSQQLLENLYLRSNNSTASAVIPGVKSDIKLAMPLVENIFNPLKRQQAFDGLRQKNGDAYEDKGPYVKKLKGLDVATNQELQDVFKMHVKADDMPADVMFKEFKNVMTSIPPEYAGPIISRYLEAAKQWRQATVTECNKLAAEKTKKQGQDSALPKDWIHFRVIVKKFYERLPDLRKLAAKDDLDKDEVKELKFWAYIAYFFLSVRTGRGEGPEMLAAEDLSLWKSKKNSETQPITYSDGVITV